MYLGEWVKAKEKLYGKVSSLIVEKAEAFNEDDCDNVPVTITIVLIRHDLWR